MPKPRHDVEELVTAMGQLVRRLRAERNAQGLSLSEAGVIGRLGRQGAATIAELARAEGITPQSMGTIVAALEAAAIVARQPHPSDRRQLLVELTPEGEALRRSVREGKRAWLAQAIAGLDAEERQTLFAAGAIMARLAAS